VRHLLPPALFCGTQSIGVPCDGCHPVVAFPGSSAETGASAPRSPDILTGRDTFLTSVSGRLHRCHSTTTALHLSERAINQTLSVTCGPPVLDRELAETGERLVMELIARRQATKYKYITDFIGQMASTAHDGEPYDSVVSGNQLTPHNSPHPDALRCERTEIARHGETTTATVHHHAGQATPEGAGAGDRRDRRGVGPERGRTATPRPGAAWDSERTDRPVSDIPRIVRAIINAVRTTP
jgi:hypothetical protein